MNGREIGGSPAHAGMVPVPAGVACRTCRFPRPRGDGPVPDPDDWFWWRVPPPTRGWSECIAFPDGSNKGSPAHAGMVPRRARAHSHVARFPRPRGDGPELPGSGGLRLRVPPPTRGWSPLAVVRTRPRVGSPAHAGMVPRPERRGVKRIGFPRPRGDGPRDRRHDRRDDRVPPPTRGWSLVTSAVGGISSGSPAHAGMVRSSSWPRS